MFAEEDDDRDLYWEKRREDRENRCESRASRREVKVCVREERVTMMKESERDVYEEVVTPNL